MKINKFRKKVESLALAVISENVGRNAMGDSLFLGKMDVTKKYCKKVEKRINAHRKLSYRKGITRGDVGQTFAGYAEYGPILSIRLDGKNMRYRLLLLFRFGKVELVAIRAGHEATLKALPNHDFCVQDIIFFLTIARLVSGGWAEQEINLRAKDPVKRAVSKNAGHIAAVAEQGLSLQDLEYLGPFRIVMDAAIIAGLHTLLPEALRFRGIFNFVVPRGGGGLTKQVLMSLLRACDFTGDPNTPLPSLIRFSIEEQGDLKNWDMARGRLAILDVSSSKFLRKITSRWELDISLRSCGDLQPYPFPGVPVVLSHSFLQQDFVVNLELPKTTTELFAPILLDKLHTAVAQVLRSAKRIKAALCNRFCWANTCGIAHRLDYNTEWLTALHHSISDILFQEADTCESARALYKVDSQQREQEAADRREIVQQGLDYLENTEGYITEIIAMPDSRDDANCALNTDETAVAIYHSVRGGDQRLYYSTVSLQRLLRRCKIEDTLFDEFVKRARMFKVLEEKKRQVTFKDDLGGKYFCRLLDSSIGLQK